MKLYFEIGLRQGESVDVTPPGISFGRETDNDIRLEEEKVSRYHAKMTQENGIWYIEDLGSSNGTALNGRTLTSREPLSLGDKITVGSTTMKLMEVGQDAPAPGAAGGAAGGAATGAATATDGSAAKPKRKSLMAPLAAILLIAMIAVIAGVVLNQPKKKTTGPGPGAPAADAKLRVHYERFQADDKTVFHYVLDVKDGTLTVVMDDLYDDLHVEREQPLTEDELKRLEKMLAKEEFFSMSSPRAIVDTRKETRVTLAVALGSRGNAVELLNTQVPPSDFSNLETHLRAFVFDTLKLVDGSRQERLTLAEEKYRLARELDESQTVSASNLYEAVEAYEYVLLLLDDMGDPPPFYQDAITKRNAAAEKLAVTLTDLRNRGRLNTQAGDLQEARRCYQEILSMVPDTSHDANREARGKLEYLQYLQDNR